MNVSQMKADRNKSGRLFALYMLLGFIFLILSSAASISFGAAKMELSTAWQALLRYEPHNHNHLIIFSLRVPRTVAGIFVGASLAVCGAVMQGSTRNPLADSGLMGISSGAAFGVAISLALFPSESQLFTILLACSGAAAATAMTYLVASAGRMGMTPQRLVLAGMTISMLFGALTTAITIRFRVSKGMLHWSAGSTASATWTELLVAAPLLAIGITVAIAISRSITMLSMGEDVASGLGLETRKTRRISIWIVLVLTGLSVVIAGPIGFIGLIIPHAVRFFVGVDYRFIIPMSALYGAAFLVFADVFGRLYNRPGETPLGVIFAIIGVPFFLYIARKIRRETI